MAGKKGMKKYPSGIRNEIVEKNQQGTSVKSFTAAFFLFIFNYLLIGRASAFGWCFFPLSNCRYVKHTFKNQAEYNNTKQVVLYARVATKMQCKNYIADRESDSKEKSESNNFCIEKRGYYHG